MNKFKSQDKIGAKRKEATLLCIGFHRILTVRRSFMKKQTNERERERETNSLSSLHHNSVSLKSQTEELLGNF